ncbi:MAG: hypothetical protein MH204_10885 [Fimbriimonadaceae bacterium]|nr:hypothetical protein [Fimbriimonadaceae bacterium]
MDARSFALPLAAALIAFGLVGCGGGDEGPDPASAPRVESQSMESIGKLTPEQEAAQLRERDTRPQEDRQEGGI